MATIKAYTDLEQSNILKDILPPESADHHYVRKICDFMGNPVDGKWSTPKYGNPNSSYANYAVQNFTSYEKLPCWSLAALFNLFDWPKLSTSSMGDGSNGVMISAYPNGYRHDSGWHDNPVDACYEMICKLHKQKLL